MRLDIFLKIVYAKIMLILVPIYKRQKYVDLLKAGICDPCKVERCCLENAVSFAISFIGSKGVIAFNKDSDKKQDE